MGRVLAPPGGPLMQTHAMLPTPRLTEQTLRILFASCDADMRGRIFAAELDRKSPTEVLNIENVPTLDLGETGAFDADGVNPSHLVERDGAVFLYYIGWCRGGAAVPYTLFGGLAISEDDGRSFRRASKAPILPPLAGEGYFRTAPYVYPTPGGWAMLYIAGETFFTGAGGKRLPVYSLYRTYSKDGIDWQAGEELLAPDLTAGEIGFGRPCLWHDELGESTLILSVRHETGYTLMASANPTGPRAGMLWQEVLPRSENGWDSDMVCFGAPCAIGPWEYLFYNGNQFGRTGFGLARRAAVVPRSSRLDLFIESMKDGRAVLG